jgi:chemotaxis protein MotB
MAAQDDDIAQLMGNESGDELWLISYADLLTLLVGFFVMLLAASPMKLARFEAMAAAINGESPPPLAELKKEIDQFIDKENLTQVVRTREDMEGLAIEFKDVLLFDSASAQVKTDGDKVLTRISTMLKDLPTRGVTIEGHTDDVPISSTTFRSNWELSSQRAINVLATLEKGGVDHRRLSVRGFADTKKLDLQGTVDVVRAAQRRVVIRVE